MALVCLVLLLSVTLGAPLHRHESPHAAACCLICHVTQRASVAPMAIDAGKPQVVKVVEILRAFSVSPRTVARDTVRTPRAPPFNFFSV